ncbi:YcdB/YcdC domain-containing protein [Brevibacillus sp. MER 51]|uniref:YcdB/YcdC domain-containing protein n=1 Tax=Brevibacillus sp. MER 51 TaxID=2939560 RepID=UPI00203EB2B8|nr:YcdB/YcdC domain-containing protein [Brevibacillus sp. MER 51]MCM3140935.1 hypothetical protein [Brevibacillus sp. MER 51]
MRMRNRAIMTCIAASVVATTPIWMSEPGFAAGKTKTVDSTKIDNINKTIDKLSKALPYMKELPDQTMDINEKSGVVVVTRKNKADSSAPQLTVYLDRSSGEINSFDLEMEIPDKEDKLSLDVQKEKAQAFLKELFGQLATELQFDESESKRINEVVFRRVINGVPYLGQNVFINVNSQGQIASFSNDENISSLTDVSTFPEPTKAISLEQAEKALTNMMKLVYRLGPSGSDPILTYQPIWSGYMDAKTGRSLDTRSAQYQPLSGQLSPAIPVTPANQKVVAKNKDEAVALLKSIVGFDPTGAAFSEQSFSDRPREGMKEYRWQKGEQSGIVVVQEKTGQVTSVGVEAKTERKVTKKVTREDAQRTAVQLLQTYLDTDTKMIVSEVNSYYSQGDPYTFTFYPTVHEIPIVDQAYSVTIHGETGKPVQLSGEFGHSKLNFPNPAKAVSAEQAAKEYLKYHPLKLVYMKPIIGGQKADLPVLAYITERNEQAGDSIDAFTGQIIQHKK